MLKLIGAVLVCGACGALGLSAGQRLTKRVRAIDAMRLAFGLICSEIEGRRTPLPTIFASLSEQPEPLLRTVFSDLSRRMASQSGYSLPFLWRCVIRAQTDAAGWGSQTCKTLCSAADYLGRYETQQQVAGLRQILKILECERASAVQEAQQKTRLYRTCGVGCGVLLVLVLL